MGDLGGFYGWMVVPLSWSIVARLAAEGWMSERESERGCAV